MEWDFYVGGLEDGIIQLLEQELGRTNNSAGYAKTVMAYGGELDAETLRRALAELAPRLPCFLIAYTDGEDAMMPATPGVFGAPRIWQHDCTFSVMCCVDDARGDKARRRGAAGNSVGLNKMIGDTRRLLAGRKFQAEFAGETVLLNLEPLRPAGVEYIARLPNLTAYSCHFDTYFKWCETDRRNAGTPVSEVIFTVQQAPGSRQAPNLPGVTIKG